MKMEFSHFEDFQSNSYIPMFVALIFAIFNQKITFRIMFSSQIFTEKVKNWSTKFCFDQIHPLVGFWPCSKIRLSLIHCWSSFSKQLAQSPPPSGIGLTYHLWYIHFHVVNTRWYDYGALKKETKKDGRNHSCFIVHKMSWNFNV